MASKQKFKVNNNAVGVVQPSGEPIKALTFYNSAKTALEKASRIDEAQMIRNKAEAMRAYAAQALDRDLQTYATEIRMRAERKIGALLKAQARVGERAGRGGDQKSTSLSNDVDRPPTLEDLGITRDQSSRWQKLAEPTEEDFERTLEGMRPSMAASRAAGGTSALLRKINQPEAEAAEIETRKKLKLPKGQFEVLVLNPPWAADNLLDLGDEVRLITDAVLAKKAHVFLWTTNDYLQAAFRVLENCSLDFVCLFGWRKEGVQQGYNEEFVVYGTKDDAKFDINKVVTSFDAPVPKVGKPEEFYSMIADATKGARLNAYAKRKIDGFERWSK